MNVKKKFLFQIFLHFFQNIQIEMILFSRYQAHLVFKKTKTSCYFDSYAINMINTSFLKNKVSLQIPKRKLKYTK